MRMYDIIEKKKNKEVLTKEEIEFFVKGYTNHEIPDYQMSSLLMAIVLNGMNDDETSCLTMAMANSGDRLYFDNTVDKHSTGGVGDKTTLIIAPIVASLGCNISKMSGRALGHTGGTIDKLESLPGFKVNLTDDEFTKQINEINIAVISQTKNIAPADKLIYALRDVTATVDSIPLIASSIMSKKIASGAKNLVLDVKVGTGAFMKNIKDARSLAKAMVKIGKMNGINTVAVLTDMNQPLGNNIGNSLEVNEVIDVLNGSGSEDIKQVSIELAAHMVSLNKKIDYKDARKQVIENINNKKGLEKFYEFIKYQGADIDKFNLLKSQYEYKIYSKDSGYVTKLDANIIGKISCSLGAGRIVKTDDIDYQAGIVLNKKINDYVTKGDLLATFYSNKPIDTVLEQLFIKNITLSNKKTKNKYILEVIK